MMGERRPYQTCKQRVGLGGSRLELGMSLRAHVEGVHIGRQLHEFGQRAVGAGARDLQTGGVQTIIVGEVDRIAVPVPSATIEPD